jgi:hypothetical protein
MTLFDFVAGRRTEEITCDVDLEHTFDSLHAHAIPDGITLNPGDQVIVHGLPDHLPLGEKRTLQARATVIRAGWLDRLRARYLAVFELAELYHVGFEPAGFTKAALRSVEG